jgi:hypothetical protein
MATDPDTAPRDPAPGGGRAWVRPVALVVSCLVIGFVAGWVLRGDDGPVTVLAPPAPDQTGEAPAGTTGRTTTAPAGGGTTAETTTTAPATTEQEAPAAPPDRAEISLAVLNATSVTGQAAQTAAQAESLGYPSVATGNAPATSDPSIVYYRQGQQAAAERVATDLEVQGVQALPTSGALAAAAPAGAQVVLVLGPG